MTNPATTAVENALIFEAKKDGLQQRQGGDWALRLTVSSAEMDQRITQAPMGTRYQCVLVEVNDDESPRDHKLEERDKWRDLGAAKQAGIRCKDPLFWAWLREELHFACGGEDAAAAAVRQTCGVTSRSEFDALHNSIARQRWHDLDARFIAWRLAENA